MGRRIHRMIRMKSDKGGRFRARNLMFDRTNIDKLVCHDGFWRTWNDGGTPSPPLSHFFRNSFSGCATKAAEPSASSTLCLSV